MIVNERFPVLSIVAKILFILGCVILVLGLVSGLFEFIEVVKFLQTEGGEWYWERKDIVSIIIFLTCIPTGLVNMAIAEIIGVLFAIEKNTRN